MEEIEIFKILLWTLRIFVAFVFSFSLGLFCDLEEEYVQNWHEESLKNTLRSLNRELKAGVYRNAN